MYVHEIVSFIYHACKHSACPNKMVLWSSVYHSRSKNGQQSWNNCQSLPAATRRLHTVPTAMASRAGGYTWLGQFSTLVTFCNPWRTHSARGSSLLSQEDRPQATPRESSWHYLQGLVALALQTLLQQLKGNTRHPCSCHPPGYAYYSGGS